METKQRMIVNKVRNFGDIITDTFGILRGNFKEFLKTCLIICGPPILVVAVLTLFINIEVFDSMGLGGDLYNDAESMANVGMSVLQTILILASTLLITTLLHLVSYSYMDLYMEDKLISFQNILTGVKRFFWRIFGTNVGLFFLIFGAMFILIFLGAISIVFIWLFMIFVFVGIFYFGVTFSIIPPMRYFEPETGFWQSISRSMKLMMGYWWKTFGLLIVIYLIVMVLGSVFILPSAIVGFVVSFHDLSEGDLTALKPLYVGINAASQLTYFFYIIPMISVGFQYFSIVEAKEGRALLDKIEEIQE